MSGLTEIRAALAAALASVPEDIEIAPIGGKFDEETEKFVIRVIVGEPTDDNRLRLDHLLGSEPDSLRALLRADPKLGGVVSTSQPLSHTGWRLFERPEQPSVLGGELTVAVYL